MSIHNILKYCSFLLIFVIIILFTILPQNVLARGGCFVGDTNILTPKGEVPISQLKSGDNIVSLNTITKQKEVSQINNVSVYKYDSYYLINGITKVTSTHPFYVIRDGQFHIVEVKDLKLGDKLFSDNNQIIPINSIEIRNTPSLVYNLENVSPNNSYFANDLLVHNKGGGGGGGGGGGHGGSSSSPYIYGGRSYAASSSCNAILDPTAKKQCQDHFFWEGIFGSFFLIIFIPIYLLSYLFKAKSFFLRGKTFTNNQDVIEYTKKIVPKFINTYDRYYSKDTENWTPMKPPPQVSPALYQNLATPDVLREKVQKLYERYESDWTNKDFEAMKSYIKESYYSKQKQIFDSSFGDNFDVTYLPKILSATPLKVDLKIDGEYVKLQINGEMIDFEVSSSGTVLSGEPNVRGFTEYWQVFVDMDKNIYLEEIEN